MAAVYSMLGAILTAILWMLGHVFTISKKIARVEFALFGNSNPKLQDYDRIFPICNTLAYMLDKLERINQGGDDADS